MQNYVCYGLEIFLAPILVYFPLTFGVCFLQISNNPCIVNSFFGFLRVKMKQIIEISIIISILVPLFKVFRV